MHSKWKIWDILKSRPKVIDPHFKVICFQTFNPFVFSILKDQFNLELFEGKKLNTLIGKEVSTSWIDDNLKSLSLFGNSDSYLIHFAEDISVDVSEQILNLDELLLDERYLILNFSKDCSLLKKLKKHKSEKLEVINVQAPAFWEEGELLSFFSNYFKVYLGYEASLEVKNKVRFDFSAYFQLFQNLQINFNDKDGELSKAEISEYLIDSKIDQFEMAELFGNKRFQLFYEKFLNAFENGNDFIQLLYFIQSHLAKVYDPSFLKNKSKLTKYDRQIQTQHNLWRPDEVTRSINYFGELLTLAKTKNRMLEYKIKGDYLKTLRI